MPKKKKNTFNLYRPQNTEQKSFKTIQLQHLNSHKSFHAKVKTVSKLRKNQQIKAKIREN